MAVLAQEVRRRFFERQLPPPNYRTVGRRVEALDARFALGKREGSKRAREKYGPVGVSTLQPDLPLDLVQIDHTWMEVVVVDREQRLSIGRPWLTLAIDVASRAVTGFSVSLEAPSALSVSLVLWHAVLPKDRWRADRELHNLDWPMGGLPRMIHVDNGKDFHSGALVRGCQEYGIALEHRPPGLPHFGGHIERLMGTMMGRCSPASRLHPVQSTGERRLRFRTTGGAEAAGVGALATLQIAGVYHLSAHATLGKSPLAAWQAGVARRKQPAVSGQRRRVLSGFLACRAAADSERRHSFSQDSLLGQGSKSMGRPAEETSPDPIRPAESGPAVGAGSKWKALAGAVRRFATTPGCVVGTPGGAETIASERRERPERTDALRPYSAAAAACKRSHEPAASKGAERKEYHPWRFSQWSLNPLEAVRHQPTCSLFRLKSGSASER